MKIIKKIINNVPVTFIKTKKFKSIAGVLVFDSPVNKDKMTTRPLLRDMLIYNTKKFPTNEALNINCLENYDATYGANSYRTGDIFTNSFYFKTLEDTYLEKGNLEKVIDTFCEIVFNPNVSSKEFDEQSFNNRKKRIEDNYKKIKENGKVYAEHRLLKHLNQEKSYSFDLELDTLSKVTPGSLYEEYLDMINNSSVSLFLIGNIDENDNVYEKITKKIKNNKEYNLHVYINNDDEQSKCDVIEISSGTQSVLHVVYYLKDMSDFEINYVMPIYKLIIGGGGSSRLFENVREKNSLAYYCFARLEKDDNTLEVIAGIDEKNYEKTIRLIDSEFERMNNITEEEISVAKKELISMLLESEDNILNILSRKKIEQIYKLPSGEEYIKKINRVTKQDVENICKKVHFGFRYFLKGSDNNG